MAAQYAAASDTEAHRTLQKYLADEAFLLRLDDEEAYLGQEENLRLGAVLVALMDNQEPVAHQTLAALTGMATFDKLQRASLLVRALEPIRPAPAAVVAYWRTHSEPDSSLRTMVINVIANNGSEPAVALLEERLSDESIAERYRRGWMRRALLRNRTKLTVLNAAERLLERLTDPLYTALVSALFDYDEDSYPLYTAPEPALWTEADDEAREAAIRIGRKVLDGELPDCLRAKVSATVELLAPPNAQAP
jgi:hypothetical protein